MFAGDSAEDKLCKPMCGQLSKYTNVVKGWQYRWFVLDPTFVCLEYYMQEKEQHAKQKPRGAISLRGALIAPSEDDSLTFTVHPANGEVYRLRAESSKSRQTWVSHMMYVTQLATSRRSSAGSHTEQRTENRAEVNRPSTTGNSVWYDGAHSRPSSQSVTAVEDNHALIEVKEYVQEMYALEEDLIDRVDSLPVQGSYINALDPDMLLLKACSKATVASLGSCLSILERQHMSLSHQACSKNYLRSGARVQWIHNAKSKGAGANTADSKVSNLLEESTKRLAAESQVGFTQPYAVPAIDHDEEECDGDVGVEKDLGEIDQHKTVILHLLSQLKLGMDLTRVVLPTFILERRSLLEMFADCMAHPDIFIKVTGQSSPESRMRQVLEWYLTSFHEGRKGSLAKKPYNPIIGETFHCSWDVAEENADTDTQSVCKVIYTAEQVSHHPPVTAFHVACPQKSISLTGSLWTKSKFMGMSIGVTLVGNLTLSLPQYNEEYVMTLPSAYARSILTYPWVELGDKCMINCKKTGFSSSIVFHTKPFYGGKLHRVSAEMKNADGLVNTKVSGTWNGELEFTSTAGVNLLDTQSLPVHRKKVRPISKQGEHESRKLWQHVTNALRYNDINTATEHKTLLENRQREEERHRKEKGLHYPTKYFQRVGDISSWAYKGSP